MSIHHHVSHRSFLHRSGTLDRKLRRFNQPCFETSHKPQQPQQTPDTLTKSESLEMSLADTKPLSWLEAREGELEAPASDSVN